MAEPNVLGVSADAELEDDENTPELAVDRRIAVSLLPTGREPQVVSGQASRHTAIGPGGEQVDVLIRTPAMQEVAEDGIAATIREISRTTGHAAAGGPVQHRGDLEWLQAAHTPHARRRLRAILELQNGGDVDGITPA